MTITIRNNQSLLDVAIHLFGTAEGAMTLARENNLSITDELQVGQKLSSKMEVDFGQKLIADYFQNKQVNPATAIVKTSLDFDWVSSLSGIDYWGIEIDFEVS